MADEPAYWRFFCYLNLFVFSMLLLVLGDSFIIMFFGWEGVGVCSYLLIGFWYKEKEERARRHEGVRGQPHRRLGFYHRPVLFILGTRRFLVEPSRDLSSGPRRVASRPSKSARVVDEPEVDQRRKTKTKMARRWCITEVAHHEGGRAPNSGETRAIPFGPTVVFSASCTINSRSPRRRWVNGRWSTH